MPYLKKTIRTNQRILNMIDNAVFESLIDEAPSFQQQKDLSQLNSAEHEACLWFLINSHNKELKNLLNQIEEGRQQLAFAEAVGNQMGFDNKKSNE